MVFLEDLLRMLLSQKIESAIPTLFAYRPPVQSTLSTVLAVFGKEKELFSVNANRECLWQILEDEGIIVSSFCYLHHQPSSKQNFLITTWTVLEKNLPFWLHTHTLLRQSDFQAFYGCCPRPWTSTGYHHSLKRMCGQAIINQSSSYDVLLIGNNRVN